LSSQERWDVVLAALGGPVAMLGEQVLRGPVVRIGANPGPGGMNLQGYRGLDARQCVITAYDGASVSVAPVGTNQVRMAPHANVNWKDIDPLVGPTYLSKGCAMHLGPVGRGCTIEFVECRRLGVWQDSALATEVGSAEQEVGRLPPGASTGAPPAAFDARRVGQVQASRVPWWFLGLTFLMTGGTTMLLVSMGVFLWLNRTIEELGPVEQGYPFYKSVDIASVDIDADALEGLHRPFYDFVMKPNTAAAGAGRSGLDKPENWDPVFLRYVTASTEQHVRAWQFFSRVEAIKREYSQVVTQLRREKLPEVMAAIPYQESRYNATAQSIVCAKGFWQFMPEMALRVERKGGLDFKVRDCRLKGSPVKWNPVALTPPLGVMKNGEYMDQGECQITGCDVDDRTDLTKSTAAAIYALDEAYADETLRRSGAIVQLTIASHNTGYHDARFGTSKSTNILPAYKTFVKTAGEARGPHFYGDNLLCQHHEDPGRCGGRLMAQTQHYVYPIIAQHLLAVCYYAQNYGEERAFEPWVGYTRSDGYCRNYRIPSKEEVMRNRSGKK
jgi:hypothetical protein